MFVRKYEAKDFEQISKWATERGTKYTPQQFPRTGFIVDNIAAYFLYRTDSSVCFLENMISNKEIPKPERDQAIKLIVAEILKEAKKQGFQVAYATTGIPAVVVRALMYGAQAEAKQTLLTKDLNDPSI